MIDNPAAASRIFKDLVKERYLISKHTHTSYNDTAHITPIEREYIFEFITDEFKKQKEAYEKLKEETSGRRR